MESHPLSDGNWLQRAYAAWAQRHYARLAPEQREQAELFDRFLYSRRGLGVWLGWAGAIAGTAAGFRQLDMPWVLALVVSALLWIGLPLGALGAWLDPDKFASTKMARRLVAAVLAGLLGGAVGFVAGHVGRHGGLDWALLGEALARHGLTLVSAALAAVIAMVGLLWGVARVRQELLERARTARQASEARLKLLQAQVQPHFVFNTLATLQHWVDTGDARAPGLLRALTAFLRGSTELLGRDEVPLRDELSVVHEYLRILQARLGNRLQVAIDIEPAAEVLPLPPGLLLTVVENAVEHGIAPALNGGTVRIDVHREGEQLVVRVRDDGAGLAPQWQPGIGLTNVRERLAHHGGRLDLHPAESGAGTEAVMSWPWRAAGAEGRR